MHRSDYHIRETIKIELKRIHDFERANHSVRTQTLIETSLTELRELEVEKENEHYNDVCLRYDKLDRNSHSSWKFAKESKIDKKTQCIRVAKELNFYHIFVDNLLREEAKFSTFSYKDFISERIQKSMLLSTQLTTLLLKQRMRKVQIEKKRHFLLDEFSRNVLQAIDFELKICDYRCFCKFFVDI